MSVVQFHRVADTLHRGPAVVAPVCVGIRLTQRVYDCIGSALRGLYQQALHCLIVRGVRRLQFVSIARKAADCAKGLVAFRWGGLQHLHVQDSGALFWRKRLDSRIGYASDYAQQRRPRCYVTHGLPPVSDYSAAAG